MSAYKITPETALTASGYDGIILVHSPENKGCENLARVVKSHLEIDPSVETETFVLPAKEYPAGKLVISSTGPLNVDYDDVRSFREGGFNAGRKIAKVGVKKPLVYLQKNERFENAPLVTLIGFLEGLYVPIQTRELKPSIVPQIDQIGVVSDSGNAQDLINLAVALESGIRVYRDIGDGDPERMAPPRVQDYVEKLFADSCIKISVISDLATIEKDYPLFEAVNRAARKQERHQGRIIFLEYSPCKSGVTQTLYLVGKGVTYDTGGADIKAGGIMAGMSRDKCGSAAVAGFMEICKLLKPKHCKVVGMMGMVRNSVGSDCYVADELVKSRNGTLVRIGNTDAEGRMVMGDILCKAKEMAVDAVNPHLFTIATLTGHVCISYGKYVAAMDNGPAKKENHAQKFQEAGESIADPIEISTIRKEDYAATNKGKCFGDDVLQCNNLPSSRSARGHQFPAAFLIRVAGLDKHDSASEKPIKYTHLDIAGAAGDFPESSTGAPLLAMAQTYLLKSM